MTQWVYFPIICITSEEMTLGILVQYRVCSSVSVHRQWTVCCLCVCSRPHMPLWGWGLLLLCPCLAWPLTEHVILEILTLNINHFLHIWLEHPPWAQWMKRLLEGICSREGLYAPQAQQQHLFLKLLLMPSLIRHTHPAILQQTQPDPPPMTAMYYPPVTHTVKHMQCWR